VSSRAQQKGFTLIEALVAIVILSIAATAIIAAFSAGTRQTLMRAERHRLASAARAELSLISAEARATGEIFSRVVERDGVVFEEAAKLAAAAIDGESGAVLMEVSVNARLVSDAAGRNAFLSGFVLTDGAQ
jgi:prepilin-type N-terminal cleavage/methylation domain-containing protein